MTFTKKKLAAAMTGTLLASVGVQTTQAAVDLDLGATTSANPISYASEAIIGTSGLGLTDTGTQMDIVGTMTANSIASDTDIRVTLTLSSGVFTAPPTMTIDDGAAGNGCDAGANACPATTIFTGGTTADSAVTFNTNSGTGVVDAGAHFNFALAGLTVTDQSSVTATVGVEIADNFGPTTLPGLSGSYAGFAALMSVAADQTNASGEAIDVVQNSVYFANVATGDNSTNVGGYRMTVNTAGPLGVTTAALIGTDVVTTHQATITAANGFAAFNQGTSVAGDDITNAGGSGTFSTADATLAVMPTAAMGAATDAAGANDITLSVPAANTVIIDETTLTATVAVTGANTAVYDASSATGTVSLQSLARNGSSARLTFATNPDSPYPMSIRITNPSSIAGPASITLTNDDGVTSAAVPITDIAGGPAGDLGAGASTALLSMADVFAAVQAADATFDLGATSNKLRVSAIAEFGAAGATAVVLNAFSLSSDGTTFSMVTNANL